MAICAQSRPASTESSAQRAAQFEAQLKPVLCYAGPPRTVKSAQHGNPATSTRQWLLHVRKGIRKNCDHGGILCQFFRDNFVQRISGRMVIIEIETTVLNRTKSRHTGLFHRPDVGPTMFDQSKHSRARLLQDCCDRREHFFHFWFSLDVDAER